MRNKRIALLCLMAAVYTIFAQTVVQASTDTKKRVEITTTEKVEFPVGGTIHIQKSFGAVTVEGWDQPEVKLTVTKAIRANDTPQDEAKAREKLKRVKVTILQSAPDTLIIHSTVPFRKNLELKYTIRIPRRSALFVKHDIGEVEVRNIVGDLSISNRIGEITLKLPESEEYNIDARTKIGDVSSEFGGDTKRKFLIGAKVGVGSNYKQPAHLVLLRLGIGDIEVNKLSN